MTDVLPALGTHAPMTGSEIEEMFPDVPGDKFRVHNWRHDVMTLGEVPGEFLSEVSGDIVSYPWKAQVNRLLKDPGFDLILSIGQVVPHEVIGMANYNKNVFVGYQAGYNETRSNKLYIANNKKTPLLFGTFSDKPSRNKLGIGTTSIPSGDAIKVWNGAHLTKGGVWANASSRELKDNIESLGAEEANAALADLHPVRYVYRNSRDEEYLGFISEDVPDLVATNDRKSLAAIEVVAVLTQVAKQQQAQLEQKDREIAALRADNAALAVQQDDLAKRQADLIRQVDLLMRAAARDAVALN
jgi:hypothetical protein